MVLKTKPLFNKQAILGVVKWNGARRRCNKTFALHLEVKYFFEFCPFCHFFPLFWSLSISAESLQPYCKQWQLLWRFSVRPSVRLSQNLPFHLEWRLMELQQKLPSAVGWNTEQIPERARFLTPIPVFVLELEEPETTWKHMKIKWKLGWFCTDGWRTNGFL